MVTVIATLCLTLASAVGITTAILVGASVWMLTVLIGAYTLSAGLLMLSLTFEMSRAGLEPTEGDER